MNKFHRIVLAVLLVFCFPACAGGPGMEPSQQKIVRLARVLGESALNVYVVPKLRADHPQILAFLDADQNGQLSAAEIEAVGNLPEGDLAVLILLVVEAVAQHR